MKKLSNATLAAARHPQAMARLVLAFVASILVILLALMGMSSGPNGATVFAQATATATPTPQDTGPAIKLLNPSPGYDPLLNPTGDPDPPKISDKFDGVDRQYHVSAWVRNAPANSIVEAYWQEDGENEITVGLLTRTVENPDTWEMYWDIPSDLAEGAGNFVVRLYQNTSTGFEEVASDSVAAELRHEGAYSEGDDTPAEETVEITYPPQGGQLGFYKPKSGFWRGYVEGVSSGPERVCAPPPGGQCQLAGGNSRTYVFYTTSAPGETPKFTACGNGNTSATLRPDGSTSWNVVCTLAGKDTPSQITALAAVASETDTPSRNGLLTQESADVHRIKGYAQDPRTMTLELLPVPGTTAANYPTGRRRVAGGGCLRLEASVKDHLGRPVQGANLDVDLQGPNDQAAFGDDEATGTASLDSNSKAPDKGAHESEGKRYCSDGGTSSLTQGEHNVPGGAGDVKHEESAAGSGLDGGGASVGRWRFLVYSASPGFSDITVWIDDEPVATEDATREADTDTLGSGEVVAKTRVQWLPGAASLTISPKADAAPPGTCNKYTVRARGGQATIPGVNVDIHAQGPTNDLDFCDPGDGTQRQAPVEGNHTAEDTGESSHPSASPDAPQIQHTEGETDEAGNFIFGITSPVTGQTKVSAWIDGEPEQNNDVQATAEVADTATKSWAASPADATVRFVNPSGYGGSGDNISNKRDADGNFHLVARVDLPEIVPGVEFFISSDGTAFTKIGDGVRVGDTDTWELFWPVGVPDDSYTLRAQITGTNKMDNRAVVVDNTMATAEITRPLNGTVAPFAEGKTTVAGVASADAEGVDVYYTKTDAAQPREEAAWILCGTTTLAAPGGNQNFQADCRLQDVNADGTPDASTEVTGIAVLAYVCDPLTGCEVQGEPIGKLTQTGDAHRVLGTEANPIVTIEPAEAAGQTAECKRFELSVKDGVGRAIAGSNVDVHLSGPIDSVEFCDLDDGTARRTPDQGEHAATTQGDEGVHQSDSPDVHHTEGETDDAGLFIFGITSGSSGDSQLQAWADQNDNDQLDGAERSDTAVMHWGGGGGGGNLRCTIKGNARDNVLRGTRRADVICGGGGDDVIRARGGKDKVYGGGGNDVLRGNGGGDLIKGGRGRDRLDGGRGRDRCRPGRGRDSRVNCES